MALNGLYRVTFKNSANSGYVSGDKVITYWDDVAEAIVTKKNGSIITSGVGLGAAQTRPPRHAVTTNYVVTTEPIDSAVYQFCDAATLVTFQFNTIFPYTNKLEYPSSASCITGIVCDLVFQGAPVVVNPSTEDAVDGQITVSATGSNGSARYSLDDVLYNEMTNTTGIFTGLGEGAYIVYARDQYNCSKSISVLLEASDVYNPIYHIEYTDLAGVDTLIEIQQRDYIGSSTEIVGSDVPFQLNLRGENQDLFSTILASNASVGITSETNLQFINLFTQDDRKYRVLYKKDGEEYWRGFLTPSLYTEQYVTPTNYYVTAEANDQLQILKETPFADSSDNLITGDLSLIKIISIVLSYTDLDLPIRSCISIFEVDMDTDPEDDPLAQTYINAETYSKKTDPLTCHDVLSNILLSFGARIFQWKGYWYLVPIDQYSDTVTYREFDVNGDYVTNGTFDPTIDIKPPRETNRAAWANRNQTLEVRPAYGKATINFNLTKVDFGIKNGGFESFATALESPNGSNGLNPRGGPKTRITAYDNWTLNLNGNVANLPFVFDAFPNRGNDNIINSKRDLENKYSGAIISNSNNATYGEDAYLQSTPQDITFSESDWIRIKFDFFALKTAQQAPAYMKFKFSFKLGDYFLRADGGWTTDDTFEWIEVNVAEGDINTWNTLEIKAQCPQIGETNTVYYFKLMHAKFSGNTWHFDSLSDLQDYPTVDLQTGYIAWVIRSGSLGTEYSWYRLEASSDSTSSPEILRPDDYDGSTNIVTWNRIEYRSVGQININGQGNGAVIRNFDNVTVEMLPQGEIAPDEHIEEVVNTKRIKEEYEISTINGDAPFDVSNAKNIYFNYYKYSDGTPTISWDRVGVDEGYSILGLFAKRVIEQHSRPMFKITGDLISDVFFGFLSYFNEQATNKRYIPMGISMNDKKRIYSVELQEVLPLTGTGGDGIGEFNSEEFTIEFDI